VFRLEVHSSLVRLDKWSNASPIFDMRLKARTLKGSKRESCIIESVSEESLSSSGRELGRAFWVAVTRGSLETFVLSLELCWPLRRARPWLWWGSPIVDICWNNVHASRSLAGLGDNHETTGVSRTYAHDDQHQYRQAKQRVHSTLATRVT
jgi:hypothetical protein